MVFNILFYALDVKIKHSQRAVMYSRFYGDCIRKMYLSI
uniref:Uncharacterized protein n=1 Tax=Anguilla anguilla TaxID=7936 RepID=A0A0E9UG70_ANGAN